MNPPLNTEKASTPAAEILKSFRTFDVETALYLKPGRGGRRTL